MTQIGPDHHKQEEIGSDKGRVNVIERFRGLVSRGLISTKI